MLRTMGDRLKFFFSHDAILLRHSFAIPKLLYILRISPCFLSPSLQEYDNLLRSTVSSIVNIHFEDPAWSQAILPMKSGGLGIRSAVQLAHSAFLASAAACSELIYSLFIYCSAYLFISFILSLILFIYCCFLYYSLFVYSFIY